MLITSWWYFPCTYSCMMSLSLKYKTRIETTESDIERKGKLISNLYFVASLTWICLLQPTSSNREECTCCWTPENVRKTRHGTIPSIVCRIWGRELPLCICQRAWRKKSTTQQKKKATNKAKINKNRGFLQTTENWAWNSLSIGEKTYWKRIEMDS